MSNTQRLNSQMKCETMNYLNDVLPEELQGCIFKIVHFSHYKFVLNHLSIFDPKEELIDIKRNFHYSYKFVDLLFQINEMERELCKAMNQGRYTSILVNTNIPEVLLRKTCGSRFEIKIRDVLMARGRFPDSLRKYLLYNKKPESKKYHNAYFLKARPDNDIIDLKSFPGGLESWSHYNNQNIAELMDLSKHQWNYLDFDIQIHNLQRYDTLKDKLDYIKQEKLNNISLLQ